MSSPLFVNGFDRLKNKWALLMTSWDKDLKCQVYLPWLSGSKCEGICLWEFCQTNSTERCELWRARTTGEMLLFCGRWSRPHDSICCWLLPDVEDGAQAWFHGSPLPPAYKEEKETPRKILPPSSSWHIHSWKTKLCFGWWWSEGGYWERKS